MRGGATTCNGCFSVRAPGSQGSLGRSGCSSAKVLIWPWCNRSAEDIANNRHTFYSEKGAAHHKNTGQNFMEGLHGSPSQHQYHNPWQQHLAALLAPTATICTYHSQQLQLTLEQPWTLISPSALQRFPRLCLCPTTSPGQDNLVLG